MTTTTSLKLPDDLKSAIARVAAFEGKTAHALMVNTLQDAMEDALLRHQFYELGEASYQETLQSNTVFSGRDVKAHMMARLKGKSPDARPQPVALDAAKPIVKA